MIGKKKLGTIRSELRARLAKKGLDQEWFNKEIQKLERSKSAHPVEFETLVLLRNALAGAARRKTGRGRPKTASR